MTRDQAKALRRGQRLIFTFSYHRTVGCVVTSNPDRNSSTVTVRWDDGGWRGRYLWENMQQFELDPEQPMENWNGVHS